MGAFSDSIVPLRVLCSDFYTAGNRNVSYLAEAVPQNWRPPEAFVTP